MRFNQIFTQDKGRTRQRTVSCPDQTFLAVKCNPITNNRLETTSLDFSGILFFCNLSEGTRTFLFQIPARIRNLCFYDNCTAFLPVFYHNI